MTAAAGDGGTALFEIFDSIFSQTLDINLYTGDAWSYGANLNVRVVNGTSIVSNILYFVRINGVLDKGSTISLEGGTYGHFLEESSVIRLLFPTILNHSSISITHVTAHNYNYHRNGGRIAALFVYVFGGSLLLDDHSSLIMDHNIVDIQNMTTDSANYAAWLMFISGVLNTISNNSLFSLQNTTMTYFSELQPSIDTRFDIVNMPSARVSSNSTIAISNFRFASQSTNFQSGLVYIALLSSVSLEIEGGSSVLVTDNSFSFKDVVIATHLVTSMGVFGKCTVDTSSTLSTSNNSLRVKRVTAPGYTATTIATFSQNVTISQSSNITANDNIFDFEDFTTGGDFNTSVFDFEATGSLLVGEGGLLEMKRTITTVTNCADATTVVTSQVNASGPLNVTGTGKIEISGGVGRQTNVSSSSASTTPSIWAAMYTTADVNVLNSGTLDISDQKFSVASSTLSSFTTTACVLCAIGGPVTLSNSATLYVRGNELEAKDSSSSSAAATNWGLMMFSQGIALSQSSSIFVKSNKISFNAVSSPSGVIFIYFVLSGDSITATSNGVLTVTQNEATLVDITASSNHFLGVKSTTDMSLSLGAQVNISSNILSTTNVSPFPSDATSTMLLLHAVTSLDTGGREGTLSISNNTLPAIRSPTNIWKITDITLLPIVHVCDNVVGGTQCYTARSGIYTCFSDASAVDVRVRHCKGTTTITPTTSLEATLSAERTLTPECQVPTPLTYFATGLYRNRYVDNVQSPIAIAPSGIPCAFTNTCPATTYHTVRYITASVYDTYLGFVLDTRGVNSANVFHAVTKSSKSQSTVTTEMGACSAYHPFACHQGLYDSPLTNSNVTCGTLLMCSNLPSTRSVGAGSIVSVSTTAPLSVTSSACSQTSPVLMGGVVTTSVSFHYGPVYGYVVKAPSSGNEPTAIAVFKSSGQWRGDATTQFTAPGGASWVVAVGNPLAPQTLPPPYAQVYLGTVYPTATRGMTPLNISSTTSAGVVCSVGEVRGFTGTLIAPKMNLDSVVYGAAVKCFTYATVNQLQRACAMSASCVGYTTVRVDGPSTREEPMCLHISNLQSDDSPPPYARMFYRRPIDTPTPCTTTIERSGNIAVYVLQSAFKTNTVVVRVNSVVTVCGGSNGFTNGFTGMDGQCDVVALCYAGHVDTNSIIEVTPTQRHASPNGCKWSFRAIVEQISVDPVQVAPPPVAPIARLDISEYTSRPVHATPYVAIIDDYSTYPIFVYRSTQATLDVTQTGYDCALYQNENGGSACPTTSVSMTTTTACQSCGSQSGFYKNGTAGRSDQCDVSMYCGGVMPLVVGGVAGCFSWNGASASALTNNTEYTGTIRVRADHAKLVSLTSQCNTFRGSIAVRRQSTTAATINVPVYPLIMNATIASSSSSSTLTPSTVAFRVLPTAPTNLATDAAAALHAGLSLNVSSASPSELVAYLGDVGPWDSRLRTYYTPSTNTLTPPITNSTFVCMIDHAAGAVATCTFQVPVGTTRSTVSVSQTDFAGASKEISLDINSPLQPEHSRSTMCGGTAGFAGKIGQMDQCNTFSPCLDQNLFSRSSITASANTTITLSFPAHIRAHSCDYTAAVIVTFFTPPPPAADAVPFSCPSLQCPYEDKCIEQSAFCDGFRDCSNGADEDSCGSWFPINDKESFCVSTDTITEISVASGADCLTQAAILSSAAFTVSSSGTCFVYAGNSTAAIFAAPSAVICLNSTTSVQTYVRLPRGPNEYTRCTASIHCNGHGAIGNVDPQDGDTCICVCFAGYTGDSCSQPLKLETVDLIIAAINASPVNSATVVLTRVASALKLSQRRISVSCQSLVPSTQNSSVLLAECIVSSVAGIAPEATAHKTSLLSLKSLDAVNVVLKASNHPLVAFISSSSPMTPLVSLENCSVSVGSCVALSNFVRIRVTTRNSTAVSTMMVEVISPSSTTTTTSSLTGARSPQRQRRQLSCIPSVTGGNGGCVASTCELDLSGDAGSEIRVINSTFENPTLITSLCIDASMTVDQGSEIGNVGTETTDTVIIDWGDFRWLLNGSIITFAMGFILVLTVGTVLLCIHHNRKKAFEKRHMDKTKGAAAQFKIALLSRLEYMQSVVRKQCIRIERVGVCATSSAIVFGILGAFLAVFYATASFSDSTFTILYEEYPDSLCDNSPTSSMPRRIFRISPQKTLCTKQSVIGETTGSVYAHGYCDGGGGMYSAIVKNGASFSACESDAPRTIPSGRCMHISTVDPKSTRNVFVRLTCSTNDLIDNRTTTLDTLTTTIDNFALLPITTIPTSITSTPTSTNINYYSQPYAVGTSLGLDTSTVPDTYASVATAKTLDGDHSLGRIVLQDVDRTFIQPDSTSSESFALEDDLYQPSMGNLSLPAISKFTPKTGDYPIGHLFGRFGSGAEDTWLAAATQAHRHYHIMGSLIDVGTALTPASSDGDGFTVSMYMRASEATRGFAYAVTDAFENKLTNQVYALERLAGIIENGKPSSFWFNTTYKVYSSVFVDGPGRTLAFATADSDRDVEKRVEVLEWNLDRIGTEYVFNGLWHHVAIVFKRDGGKLRAQLVVDGETSESKSGWSVCVEQSPPTIQTLPDPAPAYSVLQDRVSQGGLLVVGYFNGAVHGLTSTHTPQDNADILATGTNAMREHNAFPRTKTGILGLVMIVLAIVGLIGCGFTGYMTLSNSSDDALTQEEDIMKLYFTSLSEVMEKYSSTSTLADGGEDETTTTTPSMVPIRFATALRWTKLSPVHFGKLVEEIRGCTNPDDDVSLELFQVLLRVKLDDPTAQFTAPLWNTTVENDDNDSLLSEEQQGCMGKSDEEVDIDICDGSDHYLTFIATVEAAAVAAAAAIDDEDTAPNSLRKSTSKKNGTNGDFGRMVNGRNLTLSSGGGGGGGGSSIVSSLGPVITVFQSLGVWSSSLSFPIEFTSTIGSFASFISVDFVTIFTGLSSIAIPLAQLFVGLCAMCLLVYVLIEDEHFFESNLCRYVWKRDEVEELDTTTRSPPPALISTLDDHSIVADPVMHVHILPGQQCAQIDSTPIGTTTTITKTNNDDINNNKNNISESHHHHEPMTVCRTSATTAIATRSDSSSIEELQITSMGRYCPAHPTTLLAPTFQDDVIPYTNPCTCCVIIGDRPCGVTVGKLYTCGTLVKVDDAEGSGFERLCVHAVCDQHMRTTVIKQMQVLLLSHLRIIKSSGLMWTITLIVLSAVGFLYTPIVKTALMILVCHPFYQCEFGLCYDFMTQKYAVAIFLAGVIVLFLGIGFPAALMYALRLRKNKLDALFFSHEYEGRFETSTEGSISGGKNVKMAEWARFINTDGSALQKHYGTSAYHWLYLPALFVLFKVLVIVPIVALEIGSFEQRLGTCIVEIFIAAFVFLTTSTFVPTLLIGLRISSVHQLLQLGLLNLDLVTRNDSNVSLGLVMVAVTVLYLLFTAAILCTVVVGPVLSTRVGKATVEKLLLKAGISSGSRAKLWMSPTFTDDDMVNNIDNNSDVVDSTTTPTPSYKYGSDTPAATATPAGGNGGNRIIIDQLVLGSDIVIPTVDLEKTQSPTCSAYSPQESYPPIVSSSAIESRASSPSGEEGRRGFSLPGAVGGGDHPLFSQSSNVSSADGGGSGASPSHYSSPNLHRTYSAPDDSPALSPTHHHHDETNM